jgi:Domain of unknown function (DUF4352)/Protein of unknown function (DUF2510)
MTTPPTPAGWYPDPEHPGSQRYWDGSVWTEHRTAEPPPAVEPPPAPEPAEPPPAEPVEPAATERVGAHRAPDPTPEPVTEQPTAQVPYADATTSTPPEPQHVEPPLGTEPLAPVDNRKLIMWFAGAVVALLLALVLVAIYAFVIHDEDTVQIGAPTTTKTPEPTTTRAETPTDTTEPDAPIGTAPEASDGPFAFTVTGIESGKTVTDPTNEFLTKDAQGEFVVVRLSVVNTSTETATFLGTFQKLKAGGTTYSIDDEASFYVGGGFAEIPPGGQIDVGVAYDVPPGTVPESIELHADPLSPGVELPV